MKHFLTVLMCLGVAQSGWTQQLDQSEASRYWLDGFARTWFTSDALVQEQSNSGATSSGWNLLDLNPHVNPNSEMEVFAQIRVLNEFGGFFGQGTQVDVRQLRVSGVLKNKVKFNIGAKPMQSQRKRLTSSDSSFSFSPALHSSSVRRLSWLHSSRAVVVYVCMVDLGPRLMDVVAYQFVSVL